MRRAPRSPVRQTQEKRTLVLPSPGHTSRRTNAARGRQPAGLLLSCRRRERSRQPCRLHQGHCGRRSQLSQGPGRRCRERRSACRQGRHGPDRPARTAAVTRSAARAGRAAAAAVSALASAHLAAATDAHRPMLQRAGLGRARRGLPRLCSHDHQRPHMPGASRPVARGQDAGCCDGLGSGRGGTGPRLR